MESSNTDVTAGEGLQQRLDEWLKLDESHIEYHRRQWTRPYQSTKKFIQFCAPYLERSKIAMDLGCGGGAATFEFANGAPATKFIGVDINPELTALANGQAAAFNVPNLTFETGDWFDLRPRDDIDLLFSIHSLSFFPDYRSALQALFERLPCKWIAMSSLFYEGDISCTVHIEEHAHSRKAFYNTYAVPQIEAFSRAFGYSLTKFERFEIDIDLLKPDDRTRMGTYTVRCADGADGLFRRLQISGPLLMNWGFILLEKQ